MDESSDDASDDDFVSNKKTTTVPTEKKKAQPFKTPSAVVPPPKKMKEYSDEVLEDRLVGPSPFVGLVSQAKFRWVGFRLEGVCECEGCWFIPVGCRSSVRMTMHEVVHEMVVGECHEPNSDGSGSAWKAYMNARVAGLFLLVLLEYPKVRDFFSNGKLLQEVNYTILALIPKVVGNEEFQYHKYCHKQKIVNVCFADDLILFARGDFNSAKVIMESLQEFKEVSSLVPSILKSTAFFCNVASHVKSSILQMMPFEAGILPIKYLGVPLISSRLVYKDCKILLERVQNRISVWKNKSLSYAGKL
nr:hypothetical protein [Tanacetum cinerariifolium]